MQWPLTHGADPHSLIFSSQMSPLKQVKQYPSKHGGLAIVTQPFMPEASAKLLDQVAAPEDARDFAAIEAASIPPGAELPKPSGVFPRYQGPEDEA